ncbi:MULTISPECIES: LysR family transcriptional regulator [Ramlibacter]|uniref:LysR family transcriptional regulator n=1 Tax=Ramlibacter aquaticus TaxID=2780094 RepID=A0ABR9SAY9_9BURK|nr:MULTISPECIES: LysR family transcriptional regulator [Ramlibacter]MBE7939506.1 LysR family transcriptional regulator [Ramlibacter aquaticus]
MARLNFHHLHYFWAVAREGHLTRAAARLHVSQSALSSQIKQLEEELGQPLFERRGRSLELTEAGRLALGYAETIFATGNEMLAVLAGGERQETEVLRVGAVATLSRNFQENFLRPLLGRDDVTLVLQSGGLGELLPRLRLHLLDLVLSNRRVVPGADDPWRCRLLARQPVSVVGKPRRQRTAFRFPQALAETPLVLPGRDSDMRAAFDLLCEQWGVRYRLRAEADDMAMLRLLARDAECLAVLPTVVVQDELRAGKLVEHAVVPDLHEHFYAITVQRQFEPALLRSLLRRPAADVLGPVAAAAR